jgi:hypothetical protein
MKRRSTVVLLVGLLLGGASIVESQSEPIVLYQDPIVGTWKLNLARSTINVAILSRFPVPPNQVEAYRTLEDDRIQMVWTRSDANGSPVSSTTIWSARGGVTQDGSGGASRGVTITTVIGPGYFYVTHLEDGQQSHFVKKMVHGDGRTMTQTIVAAPNTPAGRLFEHVLVWDRQ